MRSIPSTRGKLYSSFNNIPHSTPKSRLLLLRSPPGTSTEHRSPRRILRPCAELLETRPRSTSKINEVAVMPATGRVSTDSSSPHNSIWSVRLALRNLFQFFGFERLPNASHGRYRKSMSRSSHSRSIFPSLPHDYIRRRRAVRRISNVVLVVLLSVALAYAIVHVSGPGGFSAPHH